MTSQELKPCECAAATLDLQVAQDVFDQLASGRLKPDPSGKFQTTKYDKENFKHVNESMKQAVGNINITCGLNLPDESRKFKKVEAIIKVADEELDMTDVDEIDDVYWQIEKDINKAKDLIQKK